jgi:hypothetical protein
VETVPEASGRTDGPLRTGLSIVDCDVHNNLPRRDALKPYLASRFHVYWDRMWVATDTHSGQLVGARPIPNSNRRDATPPSGGPAGSDLDFMRTQHLDRYGISKAILHPINEVVLLPKQGEIGAAMIAAINDWVAA